MKFGQLILGFPPAVNPKAKMYQIDFGWGCAPDPAGGAYSAPPDLAGFKERGGRGRRRKGEGRIMGGRLVPSLFRPKSRRGEVCYL